MCDNIAWRGFARWVERDLHQTHNEHDNADEDDEVRPPEALAVAHARLALALLDGSDLIALLNRHGTLVRHGGRW